MIRRTLSARSLGVVALAPLIVATTYACRPAPPKTNGNGASASPSASGSARGAATKGGFGAARSYEPPPPFHLAARRDGAFALHPMGKALVVAGDLAFADIGDDGAVKLEASLLKGLPMGNAEDDMPWVSELGGAWPDGVFLTLDMLAANGSTYRHAEVFRFTRDGWTVAKKRVEATPGTPEDQDNFHYADFAPWKDGRVLGLAAYEKQAAGGVTTAADFLAAKPRLDVLAGDTSLQPPVPDPSLCPDRLLSLPSGEIFLFGQSCATRAVSVQRWGAQGGQKSVTEVLPAYPAACEGASVWVRTLDARAADDVYLSLQLSCPDGSGAAATPPKMDVGYLAHFDGHAWSLRKTPQDAGVASLSIAPDGTVWATTDGPHTALWRTLGEGSDLEWETVPLPTLTEAPDETISAREVWAKGPRDIWVVAARYVANDADAGASFGARRFTGSIVFHTGDAPRAVAQFPLETDIRAASADVSLPQPASASCAHPFVLLARLPLGAEPRFDYAGLVAATKGHPVIDGVELREVLFKRERWVGAAGDYETLEKVRALALEKLPGNVPHPYCRFYPKVTRRFSIDAASGEVRDIEPAN